ncbi:MAG TPA: hypothetical protein VGW38_29680, partial [Chloroflexota bacterium]|nr:hypothetical protein [Chloroflexota bacterium]
MTIGASQPGVLEVRFDAIKVVNPVGIALPIAIPAQTFNVQIGDAGAGPLFAAPATPWSLPQTTGGPAKPVDVTGGGRVSYADIMEVALEWQSLRERGAPCGDLVNPAVDVNGDGCVDVADLQMVAAENGAAPAGRTTQSLEAQATTGNYTVLQVQQTTAGKTYVVNATGDQSDAKVGDGACRTSAGTCTLRAAIQEANNDAVSSRIEFNIAGTGVQTIKLSNTLPTLWDASGPTTIDGYTQPGSAANTAAAVSNAKIMVQIEGAGETQYRALAITSPRNVVRGLAFYKFSRSLWLYGRNATGNAIIGGFVGTNAAGTYGAASVPDNQAHGIAIEKGAAQNRIGGTTAAERNVISGNGRTGVSMWHGGSNGNLVYNNLIGLSPGGGSCLPNRIHGADMNYGASNNLIGGTAQGQRNVLTGNGFAGVDVSHADTTTGNQIIGNFVGTNPGGTGPVSNCSGNRWGMRVKDGVRNNLISDNVISGNRDYGIEIQSPPTEGNVTTTTHNTIRNNRIGISVDGKALPNNVGLLINGRNNTIGPANIIAHNRDDGIQLNEAVSDFNTITRNSIFGNGGLGIDLAPNGVTQNDSGDGDTGPNENLNFPVLSGATASQVTGTACGGCTVEVFL